MCISLKIKCLILLMHGATMNIHEVRSSVILIFVMKFVFLCIDCHAAVISSLVSFVSLHLYVSSEILIVFWYIYTPQVERSRLQKFHNSGCRLDVLFPRIPIGLISHAYNVTEALPGSEYLAICRFCRITVLHFNILCCSLSMKYIHIIYSEEFSASFLVAPVSCRFKLNLW